MWKRIRGLVFIFFCASVAWVILGGVTSFRTYRQDNLLKYAVGRLWGTQQAQRAPSIYYQTKELRKVETKGHDETVIETKVETVDHPMTLEGSDITVDLDLEYRKKGLLWYSTYKVFFSGKYTVKNNTGVRKEVFFDYTFPTVEGVYDNFKFIIDGKKVQEIQPSGGRAWQTMDMAPGETRIVEIHYRSQGMDQWWYMFGYNVSQIKNFKLEMNTDFKKIDFPENGISPTKKERTGKGWRLTWKYANLISGIQIGMDLPKKINPGPFASRVSFFAPVSLFFFFFLMFIITTVKNIRIHPMNYFFLAAAFFSFHLLLCYLADHIAIHFAFILSSIVSIFLVISYMRLVVGEQFALKETGISQFVYLILFSYAFFLEGYTGLAITILSILTLFVVMQFTAKIDWDKQFIKK